MTRVSWPALALAVASFFVVVAASLTLAVVLSALRPQPLAEQSWQDPCSWTSFTSSVHATVYGGAAQMVSLPDVIAARSCDGYEDPTMGAGFSFVELRESTGKTWSRLTYNLPMSVLISGYREASRPEGRR